MNLIEVIGSVSTLVQVSEQLIDQPSSDADPPSRDFELYRRVDGLSVGDASDRVANDSQKETRGLAGTRILAASGRSPIGFPIHNAEISQRPKGQTTRMGAARLPLLDR